jgi:hypothetical protein
LGAGILHNIFCFKRVPIILRIFIKRRIHDGQEQEVTQGS